MGLPGDKVQRAQDEAAQFKAKEAAKEAQKEEEKKVEAEQNKQTDKAAADLQKMQKDMDSKYSSASSYAHEADRLLMESQGHSKRGLDGVSLLQQKAECLDDANWLADCPLLKEQCHLASAKQYCPSSCGLC